MESDTSFSNAATNSLRVASVAKWCAKTRVAPQRIVPALVDGQRVNLIAFDPARDFSVLSWLEQHRGGPVEGLIAGSRRLARVGETRSVCGMPLPVYGRLGATSVGSVPWVSCFGDG